MNLDSVRQESSAYGYDDNIVFKHFVRVKAILQRNFFLMESLDPFVFWLYEYFGLGFFGYKFLDDNVTPNLYLTYLVVVNMLFLCVIWLILKFFNSKKVFLVYFIFHVGLLLYAWFSLDNVCKGYISMLILLFQFFAYLNSSKAPVRPADEYVYSSLIYGTKSGSYSNSYLYCIMVLIIMSSVWSFYDKGSGTFGDNLHYGLLLVFVMFIVNNYSVAGMNSIWSTLVVFGFLVIIALYNPLTYGIFTRISDFLNLYLDTQYENYAKSTTPPPTTYWTDFLNVKSSILNDRVSPNLFNTPQELLTFFGFSMFNFRFSDPFSLGSVLSGWVALFFELFMAFDEVLGPGEFLQVFTHRISKKEVNIPTSSINFSKWLCFPMFQCLLMFCMNSFALVPFSIIGVLAYTTRYYVMRRFWNGSATASSSVSAREDRPYYCGGGPLSGRKFILRICYITSILLESGGSGMNLYAALHALVFLASWTHDRMALLSYGVLSRRISFIMMGIFQKHPLVGGMKDPEYSFVPVSAGENCASFLTMLRGNDISLTSVSSSSVDDEESQDNNDGFYDYDYSEESVSGAGVSGVCVNGVQSNDGEVKVPVTRRTHRKHGRKKRKVSCDRLTT